MRRPKTSTSLRLGGIVVFALVLVAALNRGVEGALNLVIGGGLLLGAGAVAVWLAAQWLWQTYLIEWELRRPLSAEDLRYAPQRSPLPQAAEPRPPQWWPETAAAPDDEPPTGPAVRLVREED